MTPLTRRFALLAVTVSGPVFATELAPPPPLTTASEPEKQGGFRPLELSEPQRFPRESRYATGYHNYYTGREPMLVGPGLRLGPGVSWRVDGDAGIAYSMDFLAGGRIGLHPGDSQWVVVPEAGYTWRTPGAGHAWSVGLGLGVGEGESRPANEARSMFGGISYIPRFVVDTGMPETAYGLRHGVLVDFSENTLAAELSHQVTFVGEDAWHDVRLGLSIDVLLTFILVAGR